MYSEGRGRRDHTGLPFAEGAVPCMADARTVPNCTFERPPIGGFGLGEPSWRRASQCKRFGRADLAAISGKFSHPR